MVEFKGRELKHRDLGQALLTRFFAPLAPIALIESPPKMEGKQMFMYLSKKRINEKKEVKETKVPDKITAPESVVLIT